MRVHEVVISMNEKVTVTDTRLLQALSDPVNKIIGATVPEQISKVSEQLGVKTGIVTKFYPYLDKAEVRLDKGNKYVICRMLHRFGGNIIDLFTPLQEESNFCDNLREPCIIPRMALHCFVVNIDDDSGEFLLLGFHPNKELVGFKPAEPGNVKICSLNDINQFWIKFGSKGLDIRLPTGMVTNVGYEDDTMEPVEYADSNSVYTKEEVYNKTEVYTKEEVDELIRDRLAELLDQQDMEDD